MVPGGLRTVEPTDGERDEVGGGDRGRAGRLSLFPALATDERRDRRETRRRPATGLNQGLLLDRFSPA